MLGVPKKGVHSFRIFNIAIVDVVLTIIAAFLISYYMKYRFWKVLLVLFLLGVFLHWVFCVNTTINSFLFQN